MTDILIIAIVVVLVGLAGGYVYRAKKSGKKCIGCPESGSCPGHCSQGGCSACSGCSAKK